MLPERTVRLWLLRRQEDVQETIYWHTANHLQQNMDCLSYVWLIFHLGLALVYSMSMFFLALLVVLTNRSIIMIPFLFILQFQLNSAFSRNRVLNSSVFVSLVSWLSFDLLYFLRFIANLKLYSYKYNDR
jgi:hypothetical protein